MLRSLAFLSVVAALLITGLCVLILLSVPEYSSKYQIACEPNYTEPEYCSEYNLVYYFFWVTAGLFEDAGDLFVVLATIAIAYFTGTLWRATNALRAEAREQRNDLARIEKQQAEDTQEALRLARKSADAANRSNKLTRDIFEAEQRPWVGLYKITVTKVRLSEHTHHFDLKIDLKNTGKTPAFHALAHVRAWDTMSFPEGGQNGGTGPELQEIMTKAEAGHFNFGATIFAGDERWTTSSVSVRELTDRNRDKPPVIILFGLISYLSLVDGKFHYTQFNATLRHKGSFSIPRDNLLVADFSVQILGLDRAT